MCLGQPDWLVSAPCGLSSASRLARSCSMVRAKFQGASKSCQAWELGLGLVPVTSSTSYWPQQVTAQPDSGKRNHFLMRRGSKSHHKGPERGVCGTFFFLILFYLLYEVWGKEREQRRLVEWPGRGLWSLKSWRWITFNSWWGLMSGSWSC